MSTPEEIVRLYLKAQNLEQMRRVDEAIEFYEMAVKARFDAAGPYDRLIAIYVGRESYADVRRIAEAALENVRAIDDKKQMYVTMRDEASTRHDKRGAEF
jgi:tetratricopeptide (TPR) repeat protein